MLWAAACSALEANKESSLPCCPGVSVRCGGQGPIVAAPRPCPNLCSLPASSQCSVTCGKGYKQRLVSCSEIYTGKENYEYSYQTTINCPGMQPPSVQPCFLRECPVSATWRVGNWGSVSRQLGGHSGRLLSLRPRLRRTFPEPPGRALGGRQESASWNGLRGKEGCSDRWVWCLEQGPGVEVASPDARQPPPDSRFCHFPVEQPWWWLLSHSLVSDAL